MSTRDVWTLFLFSSWFLVRGTWANQVHEDEPPFDDEDVIPGELDSSSSPQHFIAEIDPATPALSLHQDVDFKGAELFFDGSSLSLPRPFQTKSHRFKGGLNWTIYPRENYTGTPTCLIADSANPQGPTVHENMEFIVGSIRRGCWCNDTLTVLPKPRRKGGISGVQLWSGRNAEGSFAYTDGRESRFPYSMEMLSFQLVGEWIPWTLFSNADMSGESTCLVAAEDREAGVDYVFTNVPHPFSVASVQQGCVATNSFEFAAGVHNETITKEIEDHSVGAAAPTSPPESPDEADGRGGQSNGQSGAEGGEAGISAPKTNNSSPATPKPPFKVISSVISFGIFITGLM